MTKYYIGSAVSFFFHLFLNLNGIEVINSIRESRHVHMIDNFTSIRRKEQKKIDIPVCPLDNDGKQLDISVFMAV